MRSRAPSSSSTLLTRVFTVSRLRCSPAAISASDSPPATRRSTSASRPAVSPADDGDLLVDGAAAETVGDVALAAGAAVHRLAEERSSLEQVYLDLTDTDVEYRVADEPAAVRS